MYPSFSLLFVALEYAFQLGYPPPTHPPPPGMCRWDPGTVPFRGYRQISCHVRKIARVDDSSHKMWQIHPAFRERSGKYLHDQMHLLHKIVTSRVDGA